MNAKEAAARVAVGLVKDGMALGLGTGTTAAYAVEALGERIKNEGLKIRGISTSESTTRQAIAMGITLTDFSADPELDMTIDGADEVDVNGCLIKGGGGALLREKIVASASHDMVVICDSSKMKQALGAHPLPVAVIPFGIETTLHQLSKICANLALRRSGSGMPIITDDGLYLIDMQFSSITNPLEMESRIRSVVGVAEVGLFVGIASRAVVGYDDGHTEIIVYK